MSSQIQKNRITSSELASELYRKLVDVYGRNSNQPLTPASPFVQILNAITEVSELNFQYIENAISELNILTAKNSENIFGLAALTGHNPFRGMSAKGKISIKLKPDYEQFDGDYLLIPNNTRIQCSNNGLTYTIVLNEDYLKFYKKTNKVQELFITEGSFETQTFISNGEKLQSFSILPKSLIDHFYISVFVNGEKYDIKNSLYDMYNDEKACIIKTGINGGVDAFFGNGSFGNIPEIGSLIEIKYLKNIGLLGNLTNKENEISFKFETAGYTIYNDELDLNEIFTITTTQSPIFGSNEENVEFTRKIAPYTSKNFVLVNPDNYFYFLKKYNNFSIINVYNTVNDEFKDDDNIIYLFLIPDIKKKLTNNLDYFTLEENSFKLSSNEKSMILRLIDESGQQLIGSEIYFVDPIIKKYAINIAISYYDTFLKDVIENEIKSKINQYFINNTRRDIIPKADIIALLKTIPGIDSVNVYFISETNETAMRNGKYIKKIFTFNKSTGRREWLDSKVIFLNIDENPNLGLNEFGDIKIEDGDLPILRGGWYDRNKKYYSADISDSISSINVFFTNKVPYTLNIKENIEIQNNLLK